jgi:hypothetical protein
MHCRRFVFEAMRWMIYLHQKICLSVYLVISLLRPRNLTLDVQTLPFCAHGLVNPLAFRQLDMFANIFFQRLSSWGAFVDGQGTNTGNL